MKRFKASLLPLGLVALIFTATGCGLITDALWAEFNKPAAPVAYAGFTTKTMEGGGCRVVVSNMRRGAITQTFRISRDSATYDVILFDIEMSNIGQQQLRAHGLFFKLITDEGNVVDASSMFKGGFDGDFSENKSSELYPGTKKSGIIAFALKKSSNPKKLIYGNLNSDLT